MTQKQKRRNEVFGPGSRRSDEVVILNVFHDPIRVAKLHPLDADPQQPFLGELRQ